MHYPSKIVYMNCRFEKKMASSFFSIGVGLLVQVEEESESHVEHFTTTKTLLGAEA